MKTQQTLRLAAIALFICALMLVPLINLQAADYEAVGKRLGDAVRKGEISEKQAAAMMEALKRTGGDESERKGGVGVAERIHAAGKRIRAAVEAGKLSEKDAQRWWGEAKGGIVRKAVESKEISAEQGRRILHGFAVREAEARLKAAVAKGEISQEDAKQKLMALHRGHGHSPSGKSDSDAEKLRAIQREIGRAVEAGKISRKEAEEKLRHVRREFAAKRADQRKEEVGDHKAKILASIQQAGERIKRAVRSGSISEKEGWEKWIEVKNEHIGPGLKRAVKEGHLSEAEAIGIWKGIEKAEVAEKLKAAVLKGELSEEEAKRKWQAWEKKD